MRQKLQLNRSRRLLCKPKFAILRRGRVAHDGEEGLESALDDGRGEAARGVMGAGAASLGAGLKDELGWFRAR